MESAKTALFDLNDLNLTAKCENAFEFEYLDSNGNGTSVFLSVLGSDATTVQEWVRKRMDQRRSQEALQAKRGKEVERSVEDDIDFGNEAAAIRITGWRGIAQPYSKENALTLVTINSLVREQVLKASNDLSNFTKGK